MKAERTMKITSIFGLAVAAVFTITACASTGEPHETSNITQISTTETTTAAPATTTATTSTMTSTTKAVETENKTTTATENTTAAEPSATTAKSAGDELGEFKEYLQDIYNSYPKTDGVPSEDDGYSVIKYQRFAVDDFDGDGEKELIIEDHVKSRSGHDDCNLILKEKDDLYGEIWENVVIENKAFSDVTFRDNGVASAANNGRNTSFPLIDNTEYHILNKNMLSKLNYNMSNSDANYDWSSTLYVLHYYMEGGQIKKLLGSGHEAYFDPKVKTEAEYEQDKALLNGGDVIKVDVKDFTAENIGL